MNPLLVAALTRSGRLLVSLPNNALLTETRGLATLLRAPGAWTAIV